MKEHSSEVEQKRINNNKKALNSLDNYYQEQIQLLLNGDHATPHKILGMHFDVKHDCMKIIVLDPQADTVSIVFGEKFSKSQKLKKDSKTGLFVGFFEGVKKYFDYKIQLSV